MQNKEGKDSSGEARTLYELALIFMQIRGLYTPFLKDDCLALHIVPMVVYLHISWPGDNTRNNISQYYYYLAGMDGPMSLTTSKQELEPSPLPSGCALAFIVSLRRIIILLFRDQKLIFPFLIFPVIGL